MFCPLPVLVLCGLAVSAALQAQARPVEQTQWRSGLVEIDEGWAEHQDDDLQWARPDFDDSGWKTADLEDLGGAQLGWRWFRKHLNVGSGHANPRLLIEGGDGTYEVYVNGHLLPGARIHSQFNVSRPTERVFDLSSDEGDFTIALRTHAPPNYAQYRLPLFLSITLGGPTAIGYERQALESSRLYSAAPTIVINLMLVLAGLGALGLFLNQRSQREYLLLGVYLLLTGTSDGVWVSQQAGVLPTSANLLFADPLTYLIPIAQIEFTFAFARRRVGRMLRIYQALLLLGVPTAIVDFTGVIRSDVYVFVEGLIALPAALILPLLLFRWYRHGNREAGWLILPSLMPAATSGFYNLGTASIFMGWRGLDFLDESIPLGPFSLTTTDASSVLFLLAIGVVMFFRFTRVSREQAHATAELEAAREVQERLVPPAMSVAGFQIESAYIPAKQVGGDFFHIRADERGGLLVVVGDVSGKGLPAAMGVSVLVGALRAMPELPPAQILGALNRGLFGSARDGFVTCCALRVAQDGTMTVANAGHLPPYQNGHETELEFGFPLGILADAEYSETSLALSTGDRLMLLSDGVVEARSAKGELFGFERTAGISTRAAEEIARAAQAFGQEDDITVVTLTRAPAAEAA